MNMTLHFFATRQPVVALKVLSNLAELQFEDLKLLRMMTYVLAEQDPVDEISEMMLHALQLIADLRPDEPQALYHVATTLISKGNLMILKKNVKGVRENVIKCYKEAIQLLNKVVEGDWDVRHDQIEQCALMELNRLANYIISDGLTKELVPLIDERYISPMDLDIRVVIQWDQDLADVDLHVTEPSGEECSPMHNKTQIGGFLSRDFSNYGPEEYLLRDAIPGEFIVMLKLYFKPNTPGLDTEVLVKIYTDFGRPDKEQVRGCIVKLCNSKDVATVGTITFP